MLFTNNGFLYFGDVWFDTPEEALQCDADTTIDQELTLSIKDLVDTRNISDIANMTFVSENDTLVTVTFVTNKDGMYSVYGYTEEVFIDSPTEFVATGDKDQFILFPYKIYDGTIYGWCYSNVLPIVNGIKPLAQTFEFEIQGKVWTLNYWWIDNFSASENISIDYELR